MTIHSYRNYRKCFISVKLDEFVTLNTLINDKSFFLFSHKKYNFSCYHDIFPMAQKLLTPENPSIYAE